MAGSSFALHGVLCTLSWLMVAYGSRHALQGWQRMRRARVSSTGAGLPIVRRQLLVWLMATAAQVMVIVDLVLWDAWMPPPQATGAAAEYPNYRRILGGINFLCYISATIMISLTLIRFNGIMAKSRFWHRANRAGVVLLPVLCTLMCLSNLLKNFYDDWFPLFVPTPDAPVPGWLSALQLTKRTIFMCINGGAWAIFLFFDLSAILFTFKTMLATRKELVSMRFSPAITGTDQRTWSADTLATFKEINKQLRITTMCAGVSVLDLLLYIYTLTPWFGPQSLMATFVTFCLTLHYLSVTLMMDSLKTLAKHRPAGNSAGPMGAESSPLESSPVKGSIAGQINVFAKHTRPIVSLRVLPQMHQ